MKKTAGLFLIIFVVLSYGDVVYEMSTVTRGMMGMGDSNSNIRVFIKGDMSRTEITPIDTAIHGVPDAVIMRLDKGVIWVLDDEHKEYSETVINETADIPASAGDSEAVKLPEIKVEKTGKKKVILQKECEEVTLSMSLDADGGDLSLTQTLWVTTDVPGYEELSCFTEKVTALGVTMSSSSLTADKKAYHAFQQKLNEIEGFPLETDISMSMGSVTFSVTNTITKIDTISIHPRVFEIPAGYTLKKEE